MGLSLIRQNAERAGGAFLLASEPGEGTRLEARFSWSHPDRLPMGDVGEVLVLLGVSFPELHLVYEHETKTGQYLFDTAEIVEIVGDTGLKRKEIREFLQEMIRENLQHIGAEL